ncbi:DUF4129 domain-containing protein [Halostella sp. JP-L12]|uniref:DUF4129 domain-containing protein n=1 Tax=Halostella TaxID=1843185 RepID=UPI000EF80264|nr:MULTISPECIES: DUF4129 domain-containing protein [Halostella]NHN48853.1 DUF4129 domain-containing protein [Halostella sp. JP-L12]
MAHDPRRAVLTLLCALAVLFGATLFPATGLGSAPGAGDPSGGSSTVEYTETSETTTATASETTAETTTTTTTETTTTAEPTTDDETDAEESLLVRTIGGFGGLVVVLFLAGAVAAAYLRRGAFVGALSTGADSGSDRGLPVTALVSGLAASLPDPLTRALGRIPQATMTVVFAVADGALSAGDLLGRSAGGVLRGVGGVLSAFARLFGTVPAVFAGGLAGAGSALFGGLAEVPRSVGRIATGAATRPENESDASEPDAVPSDDLRGDRTDDGPPSIDEAWEALTDRVDLSNPETKTPGEFARAAIDRGLPAEPVRRLTRVVRDVTYGGLPRTDERVGAARSAYEALDSGGDDE